MSTPPTVLRTPIPSPATDSDGYDLDPVAAILSLLALVAIPILIYAFFFAIKCPRNPFWRLRRSSGTGDLTGGRADTGVMELIPVVKYKEEAHGKEHGSECPVCLSVFSDGEEIRQVKPCKHLFHTACIDMWLYSHSSCPVCRASIGGNKRSKPPVVEGDDDLRQGLPDSSSLV